MQRLLRFLKRISPFRIGLALGLLFAVLHGWELIRREEVPFVTRLESLLKDTKFRQRGRVPHEDKVVVAAIDEKSIARYGLFPWDRHILAQLVDKLSEAGASAIAFDMSLSDEDRAGEVVGNHFRARIAEVSLAAPGGKAATRHLIEAGAELGRSAADLARLSADLKPAARPLSASARARLDEGRRKLSQAQGEFDALASAQAAVAVELAESAKGHDAESALADAIRRSGKVVVGWTALTPAELSSFTPAQIDEQLQRLAPARLAPAEFRRSLDDPRPTRLRSPPASVPHYAGLRAPLPAIAGATPGFGFYNTVFDADGVIRSQLLWMDVRGRALPSLELASVALSLGVSLRHVVPVASDEDPGLLSGVDLDGKLFIPTDERGFLRINYYGRDEPNQGKGGSKAGGPTFPQYPVADLLAGAVPASALRGKIVLIAATAVGTFDERVTPFSRVNPGVAVHANAIQTILDQRFLRGGALFQVLEMVAAVVLAVLFAFLFARVKVSFALPVLLLSAAAVHFASYRLFLAGYDVFEAVPLLEMASMFLLVTVFRYATEERDKKRLRKTFQLYLNPEVMEEMLAQPEKLQLGGDVKDLTVLFSDIRGFTGISEKLSPPALVKLLNEYLTPMTEVVFAKRGTLDKYIGDAVMAFFGAPIDNDRHALSACEAALGMMAGLARLRDTWRIEDPAMPPVDHGIGIHSGPMVVGNMGSTQRFNYTVMGDNVNLASRLEGLNKEYGTHVIISEATLAAARGAGGGSGEALAVRELDSVQVKGKEAPVRLYELRGLGEVPERDRPLLDTYANGLALYRRRKFAEARYEFETCLTIADGDGPSRLFLARCDEMLASPPGEAWDGVFRMAYK
ncbi:MAG TPA: adenylate/guanylate cyclase domain-containing protein [Myxococcales bacterium]|jgi:adenylate cyclase|nr:adenylate/guanylate cyclase domain-containing protein [Myxococcales bacterium]